MSELALLGYDARVPQRKRDPEVAAAFGRAVQVARVRRKLTRSQLAAAAGLTGDTLGRIERGEREPKLSLAVYLARALSMEPAELMQAMEEER